LVDDEIAYFGFIVGLLSFRVISLNYPVVPLKAELATAGIGDETMRADACVKHSARAVALLQLFSPRYYETLREVLNTSADPDVRPWKGLGFDAWNAELPNDGRSPNGNGFLARPTYGFVVHFEIPPMG